MTAVERSGQNRRELIRALASVKRYQLPAMCDMVSRMPNYDLVNTTSKMLLDHIDCTFATNDQVTWKLNPNSEFFLDYVLPYRVTCESIENSRREMRRMAFPAIRGCSNAREAASKLVILISESEVSKRKKLVGSAFPFDHPPLAGWKYVVSPYDPQANCRIHTLLTCALLRSVGIPSRMVERNADLRRVTVHPDIEYYDASDNRWYMCMPRDRSGSDAGVTEWLATFGICTLYSLPPYAPGDLLGKQDYDALTNLGTYSFPSGGLNVVVQDGGLTVPNAEIVIYTWSKDNSTWMSVFRIAADSLGRARFTVGSNDDERFGPYMISAGKGSKSTFRFLTVRRNETLLVRMDLSKTPNEASVELKKINN